MSEATEKKSFFSRLKDGFTGGEEAAALAAAEGYIDDVALAPWQHQELTEEQKAHLFQRLVSGLSKTGSAIGEGLGNLVLGKKAIAGALRVSVRTVERWIDDGLPTRNVFGAVRCNPHDVTDWLKLKGVDLPPAWWA